MAIAVWAVTLPALATHDSATRCGLTWKVTVDGRTYTATYTWDQAGVQTRRIDGRDYVLKHNFTLYSAPIEVADEPDIPSHTIRATLKCPKVYVVEGTTISESHTAAKVAHSKRGDLIGRHHSSGSAQRAYDAYYDAVRAAWNKANPDDLIPSRTSNQVIEITVTNEAKETYKQYDKCPDDQEAESYTVTYTENNVEVTETRERCIPE